MLVGPTCGGKTTVRNILQKAMVLLPTIQEILRADPNLSAAALSKNAMVCLSTSRIILFFAIG